MAKCKFSIEFSNTPENLIKQATEGIIKAKGQFMGDEQQGSFKIATPLGDIEGGYVIENSVITISVDNKPMLLSCNRIEGELRKFMI